MKLSITDTGDESVGIFSVTWEIDCPFDREDVEKQDLEAFRMDIESAYGNYCSGRVFAMYDFELQELAKGMEINFTDDLY